MDDPHEPRLLWWEWGGLAATATALFIYAIALQPSCTHCNLTETTMSQTAEAISLYKLHNKNLPTSLKQLVPEFVRHIPKDTWGAPLIYRPTPSGYRLGSYGADGVPGGRNEDADLWRETP